MAAAKTTTLTLRFRGLEAELLDAMVASGLFNSKSEAIRATLVHYGMETGFMERLRLWREFKKIKPRNVSVKQIERDLQRIEDEA
jgi:Arc/MetJ-type ribon-helix-helix transcriptional regulator